MSLTVQIVNDSEQSDSDVYVLLTADAAAVPGTTLPAYITQVPPAAAVTAPCLNTLPQPSSGNTITSPFSGNSCNVYQFDVDTVTSGRLLVSFGQAIVYDAAPTAQEENFRWDKMEFGYPASGADLTSLDFFGIPLQFEYLDSSGNVLGARTFYGSTMTLLEQLAAIDSSGTGAAFQQSATNGPVSGWTQTDGLSNFLRVLGPQTMAAASSTNSPAPYPSFSSYLASVTNAGNTFTVSGVAGVGAPAPQPNSTSYDYSGTFTSDDNGGYVLTLTGTTAPVSPATNAGPYGLYTDSSNTTTAQELPASLGVVLTLPASSLDLDIYGAVATSFSVENLPAADANYAANSIYATIAGDILAGLHFGYLDGVWGNSGAEWYSNPPTPYPFGCARPSKDGYYNPYAAVFYNLSGAYGFPYSDRGGRPSPYVPQPADATTLRITILPDVRLDQPQVSANTTTTSGELDLSWTALNVPTGFTLTGYDVAISPVAAVPSGGTGTLTGLTYTVTAIATATGITIDGLAPGVNYTVTLTATGTAGNGNAVQSHPATISALSGGTATAPSGELPFMMTLNWSASPTMPTGASFSIAGTSYDVNGAPATVNAADGTNIFPLTATIDGATYQGNYVVTLTSPSSGNYSLVGTPQLLGNTLPLVLARPGPVYGITAATQMMLGTPFAPEADKKTAAVSVPSS